MGGFAVSSLFIFSDPTAFIGPALPAIGGFPANLTPVLAAGTPMPDFPPGTAKDLSAIFDCAKDDDNGAGMDGRTAAANAASEETAAEDADRFIPGEESLGGRPETDEDRAAAADAPAAADGEASRRLPSGGLAAAELVAPPVDARLDLGGGSRLLPARVGFEGAFAVVDELAPVLDDASFVSRGPSAVFFLVCGACVDRR